MERPKWVKDKKVADDFSVITAEKFNPWLDKMDPSGCYLLIRVYLDSLEIGVAVCDKEHTILKEFRGTKSQDIYHEMINRQCHEYIQLFSHWCYLGKELKKAEICLAMGLEYTQE